MKWNRPECYLPIAGAAMCGIALLPGLPYGYFMLLRWVIAGTFALLAYLAFGSGRQHAGIACIVGAVLFNPILKIHLGRDLWWFVDLAAIPALAALAAIAPVWKKENDHGSR